MRAARDSSQAVHTGPFTEALSSVPLDHLIDLALIFRCAHTSSDVWAGCRVHRALGRYARTSLSEYLSGKYFNGLWDDLSEEFEALSVVKMHAEDFLAMHTEL